MCTAGTHCHAARAQERPVPRARARPPAPSASCRRGCAGRRGRARAPPARGPAAARVCPPRPARRREPMPRMFRHLAHPLLLLTLHTPRTYHCMHARGSSSSPVPAVHGLGWLRPAARATARGRRGCTGQRCSVRVKEVVLTHASSASRSFTSIAPAYGGRPRTCARTRRRCASAKRSWRRAAQAGCPTPNLARRSPTRRGRAWRAASRAPPPARRARPRRARLRSSSPSRARRSAWRSVRRSRLRRSLPRYGPLFTALLQAPTAAWT